MKKNHFLRFVSVILLTYSTLSGAVVLNIDSNGKLLGATGITVGSAVYDVAFLDGSCISLFGGCDELSDFFFNDQASANAANIELFNQVLIDSPLGNFDTNPGLTNGCGSSVRCGIQTPISVTSPVTESLSLATALNRDFEPRDVTGGGIGVRASDFTSNDNVTYAVWSGSPVPVPAAVWLFGTGLIGLVGVSRRKVS